MILRGIFHVVSCFPLHFMLYRGNLNYFSDSVLYYAMSSFRMLSDVCKREITRTPSEKNSESGSVTRFVDIFYETNPPEPLRNSQKGFAERFVFAEIFGN